MSVGRLVAPDDDVRVMMMEAAACMHDDDGCVGMHTYVRSMSACGSL